MATGATWRIKGDALEACSCDFGCPCQFGADPSRGFCEGVVGLHIQEGNYGNTRLGGLNLVLILRSPGNLFKGGWTLGVYIDQRATQDQLQALETILSGQAGGMFAALGGLIETPLTPKQVPIDFQTVGGEHRVTVAGLLEMGSEPIPNPAPDQPPLDVQVANSASPLFIGSVKSRRSGVMKLTDPDLKFDHSGQSALTGEFDFKGP